MNSKKITSLCVHKIKVNKTIGIIHIHDILNQTLVNVGKNIGTDNTFHSNNFNNSTIYIVYFKKTN